MAPPPQVEHAQALQPLAAGWPILLGSVLLGVAATWSVVTRVDVVVTAPAAAVVIGGSAELRAPDARRVLDVLASEGDVVGAGDLLVQLEVSGAEARWQALRAQAERGQRDRWRALAVLGALRGAPDPVSDDHAMQALAERRGRIDALEAEARALTTELAGLEARLTTLQRLRRITHERFTAAARARRAGALSRFDLLRLEQEDVRQLAQLEAVALQRRVLADRREASLGATLAARLAQERALEDEVRALDRELAELSAAMAEADERRRLGEIRAPVAGLVDALHVAAGDVVAHGEVLGVVVPAGPPIVFEARVPTALMASLAEGQRCRIKLDAVPFARYGALPCTVARVARGAVQSGRGPAHYPVRVLPHPNGLMVDGAPFELQPGATGWIDFVAGRRTVASYLTEPLRRFAAESLREP